MMCEALQRLDIYCSLQEYSYVGFGSMYFSDFMLFHKRLGIDDMVSIERDRHHREPFEFNLPFDCVQMQFGKSTSVLPKLEWDKPSIVWLDYEETVTPTTLADINTIVEKCSSGGTLIITVNSDGPRR